MMRRAVDTATPLCGAVGLLPVLPALVNLPVSLHAVLGENLGLWWAGILAVCYLIDLPGIWLRKRSPKWSFNLELPTLIAGSGVSAVFATSVFLDRGLAGWTVAWWIYGISLYQFFRFYELIRARRRAEKLVESMRMHWDQDDYP